MSGRRAALLDLYDTLAWTDWPRLRALLQERTGLSARRLMDAFTATRPLRSVGAFGDAEGDLRAVLEAAGSDASDDEVREMVAFESRFLADGVHLWDDVLPVLRELRARGVATAVVSNCDHNTGPIVDRLGLAAEVDLVILSFEVGAAKPEPAIYRAALDGLGVSAPAAIFVDDQAAYCDGAAALGIATALMVREEAALDGGVSTPGGHRVVRDLGFLPDLL